MTTLGRFEIVRLVLGWGEHVEILEPLALRQEIAQHLQVAARKYATDMAAPATVKEGFSPL